jgi:hypothetical protein
MSLSTGRKVLRRASANIVGNIAVAAVTTSVLLGALQTGGAGASTASDKAQAKHYLLTLSDMPAGWTREKGSSGNGSGSFPGATQLASCIGVPSNLISSNPPEVDSPYYQNKAQTLEIQDSVSIFHSPKVAKAELAAMANAKTPSCMANLMNGTFKTKIAASAGKGATVGTITVTRADPAQFGNGTTGLVMSLPISSQGISVTATIAAVYYVKGKFGQQIDFNSYGSAFPSGIAKSITTVAINRL